jgi:hypothetical protein
MEKAQQELERQKSNAAGDPIYLSDEELELFYSFDIVIDLRLGRKMKVKIGWRNDF